MTALAFVSIYNAATKVLDHSLLPLEGDEACRYRDLEVRLLPKLAFFALWDNADVGQTCPSFGIPP